MDDTIRTLMGIILGGVIGIIIVYGLHLILTDICNRLERIEQRQEKEEFRQDDLEKSYTNFLQEFKELLLGVMEKQKQDQVDTKDKNNG